MTQKSDLPVIYASIGNREDVNVNPTRAQVVGSIFTSPFADKYRQMIADGVKPDARDFYISKLELALLETLSDDFLAARIRELSNDPEVMDGRGEICGDILRLVANKLSSPDNL